MLPPIPIKEILVVPARQAASLRGGCGSLRAGRSRRRALVSCRSRRRRQRLFPGSCPKAAATVLRLTTDQESLKVPAIVHPQNSYSRIVLFPYQIFTNICHLP